MATKKVAKRKPVKRKVAKRKPVKRKKAAKRKVSRAKKSKAKKSRKLQAKTKRKVAKPVRKKPGKRRPGKKPKSGAKRRKASKQRIRRKKPASIPVYESGARDSRIPRVKRARKAAIEALTYEIQDEQAKREARNKRRRELWAAKPETEKEIIRARRRAKYAESKRARKPVTDEYGDDYRPRRKRTEVKYMNVGDIQYLNDQPQLEDSRYTLTSHFNVKAPTGDSLAAVFEAAFKGKLVHSGYEADEVSIYKYGIVFRPEFGKVTADIEHQMLLIMEELNVGGSIIVVHESPTVDSVHIKLGTNEEPLLAGDVSNLLMKFRSIWEDIHALLDNNWDGLVWMAEWDSDEEMGKSG
jgi:hypothetical protein